jgi:hypothetical protein
MRHGRPEGLLEDAKRPALLTAVGENSRANVQNVREDSSADRLARDLMISEVIRREFRRRDVRVLDVRRRI